LIFGFNTDIKHADIVYHVQSEARAADQLLQTQVFIRGRCMGKCSSSYADHSTAAGFSDEKLHELLKAQHRRVLDAIKEGKLDEVIQPLHPTS
jgi:hypothetical protein